MPTISTRRPTSQEWEDQRHLVEKFYHEMRLSEVMDLVQKLSGFTATKRQYKKKISEWGLSKNIPDKEMRAIISLQEERLQEGKSSAFEYRGRKVDQNKIERFKRRRKPNADGKWFSGCKDASNNMLVLALTIFKLFHKT